MSRIIPLLRVVALVVLAGCTREAGQATEVLLEIDAEKGVQARADALEVTIRGGSADDELVAYTSEDPYSVRRPAFPVRVGLVPRQGDATRRYDVVVVALDAEGDVVAQGRIVSGYIPGALRFARLVLEDSCIGAQFGCEAGDEPRTCRSGECVSARVHPHDLARDVVKAPPTGPSADANFPDEVRPPDAEVTVGAPEDASMQTSAPVDASTLDAEPMMLTDSGSDGGLAVDASVPSHPMPDANFCVLGKSRLRCTLAP